MSLRPNILIILTDSTQANALGCYGGPPLTPRIDRMAAEGVRFDRAYATTPLCHPARSAMLTGLYPHANGTLCNNLHGHYVPRLDQSLPTFYSLLADAGYCCGYAGQGAPANTRGIRDLRSGYATFNLRMRARGIPGDPANIPGTPKEGRVVDSVDEVRDHHYLRDGLDLLEQYARLETPWLLSVEFDGPHLPCTPLRRIWESIDPHAIRLPASLSDPLDDRADRYRRSRISGGWEAWTDEQWVEAVRLYLAVIAMHDEFIGILLDRLDAIGHGRDTLVVFASDHGEYVGELGLFSKINAMSEAVLRVPLVMRPPAGMRTGQVRSELVSATDWLPTFCELAGAAVPERCHGRSLVPLLGGHTPGDWRKGLIGTYHGDGRRWYTLRSYRDSRYKYVWDPFGTDELFDLDSDPGERHNLIRSPEHADLIQRMAAEMADKLRRLGDPVALSSTAFLARPGAWIAGGPTDEASTSRTT